ncbi:MAG: diaminopimelate epimerase [Acidobacteriota bacterium]
MAEPLEFYKFSGAGNDFILGDNRQGAWNAAPLPRLARGLCRRGLSVGADGLVLLETSTKAHLRLRLFNPDGSESPFCGNGARCAARYAFLKVAAGRTMSLETGAGVVSARVLPDGRVEVEVPLPPEEPAPVEVSLPRGTVPGLRVLAGVPHLVVFVRDLSALPVASLGAALRSAPEAGPLGANVDFVSLAGGPPYGVRTFERGVEGETLACGTGAVAVASVLWSRRLVSGPVRLLPRSGKELEVAPSGGRSPFCRLTGEARPVYRGFLAQESLEEALSCG